MKRMERDTSICKYCENPEVCNLESCMKAREYYKLEEICIKKQLLKGVLYFVFALISLLFVFIYLGYNIILK